MLMELLMPELTDARKLAGQRPAMAYAYMPSRTSLIEFPCLCRDNHRLSDSESANFPTPFGPGRVFLLRQTVELDRLDVSGIRRFGSGPGNPRNSCRNRRRARLARHPHQVLREARSSCTLRRHRKGSRLAPPRQLLGSGTSECPGDRAHDHGGSASACDHLVAGKPFD